MTKSRRRQSGEGNISEYQTKAGPRFLIKYQAVRDDGTKYMVLQRGHLTRKAAAAALLTQRSAVRAGTHVAPTKVTVEQHMNEWLDGLRLCPSTVAYYRKNVRLHVAPYVGHLRLEQLTGTRLTAMYRTLERTGRADGKGGLSARTVRYVHTIFHSGLKAAVRDGRLAANPADKATPPSAREATSPEMKCWTGSELLAFLTWSLLSISDELFAAWRLLGYTGMRRGELLGLRWGDIDLEKGLVSVRRSATLIKVKGEPERIEVGLPKSGRSRVVDIDPETVAIMRSHRVARAGLSLSFARDDAYVFGDLAGDVRHPERFSRTFQSRLRAARKVLGADELSTVRLHDLRHTHASILLNSGTAIKVVTERLGHASEMITLSVYAHVMPGMQREAATRFAALVGGGTQ